jgi:RsmE family RNA methyltransferase
MNIILFDPIEINRPLKKDDPRAVHVLNVLNRKIGDSTDVGLVEGPRGKATLQSIDAESISFQFKWGAAPKPLWPIDLIVGLSRPQTCRKILQEATTLGVRSMFFVRTDRGEDSYQSSKLWTTDQWQRLVRSGVEQAFSTRFPRVEIGVSIEDAIAATRPAERLICMDNYEANSTLLAAVDNARSAVTAIGSERGWTERERNLFREHGYTLAHLGERPLRTETAVIAAASVVKESIRSKLPLNG